MPPVTAAAVCRSAADLVGGERRREYGEALASCSRIAGLWTAYLQARGEPAAPIGPLDVAQMMVLLKIARGLGGAHHPDTYVDQAGYAGLAGEIAERMLP